MARYLVRRLIGAVGVIFAVSLVAFSLFSLVPAVTGANAAYLYVGRISTPAQVAAVERSFGLDQPYVVQYVQFITGIFTGRTFDDGSGSGAQPCPAPCFGYSFRYHEPVWDTMMRALPVTVSLAVGAAILWLVIGISIGVLSALRRGTLADRVAMIIALGGVSLPIYFTGIMLIFIFVYGPIPILPPPAYVPLTQSPLLWFQGLILAWISLAFLYAALYARLTRANMLDTLGEDYIRTARSKGLSERKVISKHALRAALTPIVTIFGLDIGALLGGAVLTEKTFNLPGLGYISINAISKQDLPVILGVTMLAAFFIVFANIIVDLLYAVIDPRVRYG